MYKLINQNFALRLKKPLGSIVTKDELKQIFGQHTDKRIEQKLNIFFINADKPTKSHKQGRNRNQDNQANVNKSDDSGEQDSGGGSSDGDSNS